MVGEFSLDGVELVRLTMGGTWATKIQSAGGVIREARLCPTGRKADCRARASTQRVRPA